MTKIFRLGGQQTKFNPNCKSTVLTHTLKCIHAFTWFKRLFSNQHVNQCPVLQPLLRAAEVGLRRAARSVSYRVVTVMVGAG